MFNIVRYIQMAVISGLVMKIVKVTQVELAIMVLVSRIDVTLYPILLTSLSLSMVNERLQQQSTKRSKERIQS